MRRVAPALAWIMVALLPCRPVSATDLTPDEANAQLTSVAKCERYAFATNPTGLFRAPLDTKRWERLETPPEIPLNGKFASQPGRSPLILYFARPPYRRPTDPPADRNLRFGLYLSRDDGQTWQLAAARDDFGFVLLHPDGSIYAATGADAANDGRRIERSTDLGKTWRDITGKAFGGIQSIEVDPERPHLVRVHSWGIRGYTSTATDENYDWNTRMSGWGQAAGRRPSSEFFRRDSGSTNRFYMYAATLANYFGYDFGDKTSVQAFEVVPTQPRFEFARGQRVVIPVRVVFHYDPDVIRRGPNGPTRMAKPPVERFADWHGEVSFWSCRIETADGQFVGVPESRKLVKPQDHTPAPGLLVSDLTPSSPYQRDLDLSHLFNFAKLGEYRVQIVYGSYGLPETDKTIWNGSFTSPVFTVVVRD